MFNFFKNKKINEENTLKENTKEFLGTFEKIIKNTKDIMLLKQMLKFIANNIQSEIFLKYYYYDKNYPFGGIIGLIQRSLDLGEEYSYKRLEKELELKIIETPIISCVGIGDKIEYCLNNIGKINNNKFDGRNINISTILIEPLGLVLVNNGGHHSVNSAIIQNEGNIYINEIRNISKILDRYKFDGENYIEIETNKKINSNCLIDKSKPLLYSLGILFEIARLLKNNNIDLIEVG